MPQFTERESGLLAKLKKKSNTLVREKDDTIGSPRIPVQVNLLQIDPLGNILTPIHWQDITLGSQCRWLSCYISNVQLQIYSVCLTILPIIYPLFTFDQSTELAADVVQTTSTNGDSPDLVQLVRLFVHVPRCRTRLLLLFPW